MAPGDKEYGGDGRASGVHGRLATRRITYDCIVAATDTEDGGSENGNGRKNKSMVEMHALEKLRGVHDGSQLEKWRSNKLVDDKYWLDQTGHSMETFTDEGGTGELVRTCEIETPTNEAVVGGSDYVEEFNIRREDGLEVETVGARGDDNIVDKDNQGVNEDDYYYPAPVDKHNRDFSKNHIGTNRYNNEMFETLNEMSTNIEKDIIEKKDTSDMITPKYINRLASVTSLIPLNNVMKLLADEQLEFSRDDYVTDPVETNSDYIGVVDFCKEEDDRAREELKEELKGELKGELTSKDSSDNSNHHKRKQAPKQVPRKVHKPQTRKPKTSRAGPKP